MPLNKAFVPFQTQRVLLLSSHSQTKNSYQDRAGKICYHNGGKRGHVCPGMVGSRGWQQAKCGLRACVCLLSARISEN